MTKLEVCDLLPNGIIIFKNKKIDLINRYMLRILNIESLSKKNAIEVFLKTINIENEENLFLLFTNNEYFKCKDATILISKNQHDDLYIFSFTTLTASLCGSIASDGREHTRVISKNVDTEVANFFKINQISKVNVLTFYKGLPLNKFGKILRLSENFIEVLVDRKHHISLLESTSILLISNTKKGRLTLRGNVANTNENIFKINNFVFAKEDMHKRQSIRIEPTVKVIAHVEDSNAKVFEFNVCDLSEKSISIFINSPQEEEFLKKQTSIYITLNDDIILVQTKYLKTDYKEEETLKVIFLIVSSGKSSKKIIEYLFKEQNMIIREIHNYQS
ncbi:hypothetical protein [Sulfurimonas sp.]|uniref:hypothetical protein n=1 Tax=Sulfurimonas sp. TaxID=2022749 RepID=UPI0025EE094B|nr:hypothetical protein [Sulfurimonas sp.]MBT5933862.1 hypothetical protein [Sulfurimonas sp.]